MICRKVCYSKSSWCYTFALVVFSVWKMKCFHIKVRKAKRSINYVDYQRVRVILLHLVTKGLSTSFILAQKSAYIEFVGLERRKYKQMVEILVLKSLEFMSIVIDCSDQSAYTLPHFVYKVKDTRGKGIKVHLKGLLHHGVENHLHLYTMTADQVTGSNQIMECVHRFINDTARDQPLPKCLFIQLDSCCREKPIHPIMLRVACPLIGIWGCGIQLFIGWTKNLWCPSVFCGHLEQSDHYDALKMTKLYE